MSPPKSSDAFGANVSRETTHIGLNGAAANFDDSPASPGNSSASTGFSRALRTADFRRIAENGFGDGSNSYAYSAVWYDEHLYIGSNRDIIPMLLMRAPFKITFDIPPVPVPNEWTELDLRGQIWRYSVRTGQWNRVYHSPLVPGYEGRMTPQAFGFRGMTVFKGTSDARPAIYTIPAVGRMALQSVTLRSSDGTSFDVLPDPRVPGLDEQFGSVRAMAAFKGKLFVAPSASRPNPKAQRDESGRDVYVSMVNTARQSAVLCSSDPASGEWALSSLPVFGDSTNASIIDMCVCGDYLYVGTLNVRHGFQLWRTTADGPPPHDWELVIDRGADRGAYNQAVLSMTAFQGDLYIGTCIQNGGFDRVYQIGPAAGEVLRVRPNGTWDLVVGDPRMTRQGLKVPTSGMRSGFNNPLTCYIWRMCAHDGAIYVGTCDNSSFVPYSSPETLPAHVRRLLDPESLERFMDRFGGCELWRSTDGDNWMPVTRNGFGNRYNLGIRALVSTPHGLFAGTANPFGPKVAVRRGSGWEYQDNPRGGLEVWLGSIHDPPKPDAILRVEMNAKWVSVSTEQPGDVTSIRPDASDEAALSGNYQLLERAMVEAGILRNPFLRLASTPPDLVGLYATVESELAEYYGSAARNVGFWPRRSISPTEACEALVDKLCGLLPQRPGLSILVLGAGSGELIELVRKRFADCRIEGGSPEAWPNFGDEAFDAAVCIEVGSWLARGDFFRRLAQSLKPGGQAALSECFAPGTAEASGSPAAEITQAAIAAGLEVTEFRDVTSNAWVPFYDHSRSYWLIKLLLQQVSTETHAAVLAALPGGCTGVHSYGLALLTKPSER